MTCQYYSNHKTIACTSLTCCRPTDLPTVPLVAGQSRFFTRCPAPAKSWKCPGFCTKSDFRFLAKIPNGAAAESPCYSVFWNAIDFCRLYRPTSKKNLNVGPANRPAFCRQVPIFYAKCPSKNVSRLAGLVA